MGNYRKHASSKFARVQHHKRLKKRLKGTGLFPFDDDRGKSKSQMASRMGK